MSSLITARICARCSDFAFSRSRALVNGRRELWGSEELTRLAAYALAGIAARVAADEATDALIEALQEPDGDTRYCAVEALGHIASSRALPELERLAKSDDEDTSFGKVADAARVAIRRVKEAQRRGRARR
jgi:HEAT repeat protein